MVERKREGEREGERKKERERKRRREKEKEGERGEIQQMLITVECGNSPVSKNFKKFFK
jgi:hypothetical protein